MLVGSPTLLEAEVFPVHLMEFPLANPPSPPRRKRSKAAEQAVETAGELVKKNLLDLGEFNSLGPE